MHYREARTILSPKNGMNLYRGCTHGCIYCDSRSVCYGMNHPFTDVEVKINSPLLLESALRRKRSPCMVGCGAMSDPYLPLEETEKMTRTALELILRYGFGVTLITKSDLVLRDLDLLTAIHKKTKAVVQMTLTTFDEELCKKIEPNVATTARRIHALNVLRDAGIPTVVWLCPILPFINDTKENIDQILDACFQAKVQGILSYGMGVTLRQGNREYFYEQLDRSFPGMKERYMAAFGESYVCQSPQNDALMELFHRRCHREKVMDRPEEIFTYLRTFVCKEAGEQLSLF